MRRTTSNASIVVRLASGFLFCLLLLGIPKLAPAQRRSAPASGSTVRSQAFVSFQNERGQITCREATSDERSKSAVRSGGGSMRVIYSGAPRRKENTEFAQRRSQIRATTLPKPYLNH